MTQFWWICAAIQMMQPSIGEFRCSVHSFQLQCHNTTAAIDGKHSICQKSYHGMLQKLIFNTLYRLWLCQAQIVERVRKLGSLKMLARFTVITVETSNAKKITLSFENCLTLTCTVYSDWLILLSHFANQKLLAWYHFWLLKKKMLQSQHTSLHNVR